MHGLNLMQHYLKDREAWHAAVHEATKSQTQHYLLNNNNIRLYPLVFITPKRNCQINRNNNHHNHTNVLHS